MCAFDAYEWNECICIKIAEGFLTSGYFRTMRVLGFRALIALLLLSQRYFGFDTLRFDNPLAFECLLNFCF
jgi:hypothetical protein